MIYITQLHVALGPNNTDDIIIQIWDEDIEADVSDTPPYVHSDTAAE